MDITTLFSIKITVRNHILRTGGVVGKGIVGEGKGKSTLKLIVMTQNENEVDTQLNRWRVEANIGTSVVLVERF